MVKQIIVNPLEGIVIEDKIINLGMKAAEVSDILGTPEIVVGNQYYYFGNNLRIDFDDGKRVEFIEFLGGVDSSLQPVIYGMAVFECTADELYQLLAVRNDGKIVDKEKGYSYAFVNISVGVYRESVPENIAEMEAEGASAEDLEYERKKAHHWATLGIGAPGYY